MAHQGSSHLKAPSPQVSGIQASPLPLATVPLVPYARTAGQLLPLRALDTPSPEQDSRWHVGKDIMVWANLVTDHFTDAEFVMFLDTDSILAYPVTCQSLFDDAGKPLWCARPTFSFPRQVSTSPTRLRCLLQMGREAWQRGKG